MNVTEVNDSALCRICLKYKCNSINLFDGDVKAEEIIHTLKQCFEIILSYATNLPSTICNECIKELEIADDFRKKCLTFEKRFKVLSQELSYNNDGFNKFEERDIKSIDNNCEPLVEYNDDSVFPDDINTASNKFECEICENFYENGVLLKQHMRTHKTKKHIGKITGFGADRRYHCSKCNYSTPHSQTLVNHMRRHNGERPYHCECGKSFTQSSSLSAHKKTHSNLTYYMCTVCGKQFKHAFTLKKHSKVHENAKFSCVICQKKLKSQESLQDHMHRHYNVRNFNCEDCGDTFVTSSELLNHKKKHSSVKKIECHLCGYKTHTKKNLIVHLKRHAGDKSYKCEVCNVAFFSSGDVQRHQRVHTREKPFTCPVCVQRFTYSTSLNKHMLTVHNIKYKWADFKWKELRTIKNPVQIK